MIISDGNKKKQVMENRRTGNHAGVCVSVVCVCVRARTWMGKRWKERAHNDIVYGILKYI